MKHYQINQGDGLRIVGGSFTLAEIKTMFNALALDIESDKAANIEGSGKERALAKLQKLIEANE